MSLHLPQNVRKQTTPCRVGSPALGEQRLPYGRPYPMLGKVFLLAKRLVWLLPAIIKMEQCTENNRFAIVQQSS